MKTTTKRPHRVQRIAKAVAASFAARQRAAASVFLNEYDGPERVRVQFAVLALARGNVDELVRLVRAAQLDYRDVLYWAEYPEESKSMTLEEAADRYRALGVQVPGSLIRRKKPKLK